MRSSSNAQRAHAHGHKMVALDMNLYYVRLYPSRGSIDENHIERFNLNGNFYALDRKNFRQCQCLGNNQGANGHFVVICIVKRSKKRISPLFEIILSAHLRLDLRGIQLWSYMCDHFRSRAHVIIYRISKNWSQN